jgi:magnesium transporter
MNRVTSSRVYRSRLEKSREKEEIRVMLLDSKGNGEQYLMTRQEILETLKEDAKKLKEIPFGEMKAKDLRSLDTNLSFASEPKVLIRTLCCMLSLDPIYAFIMHDKVLLIIPPGADGILQGIKTNLQKLLCTTNLNEEDNNPGETVKDAVREYKRESSETDSTLVVNDQQILTSDKSKDGNRDVTFNGDGKREGSSEVAAHYKERVNISSNHPKSASKSHSFGFMRSPRQSIGSKRHHGHLSQASVDDVPFHFTALEILLDTAAAQIKKDVEMLKCERGSVKDIVAANKLHARISSARAKIVSMRDVVEDFVSDEKDMGLLSYDSIIDFYSRGNSLLDEVDAWVPNEMDVNEGEDLIEDFISRMDGAIYDIDVLKFTVEEIISNLQNAFEERRTSLMLLHIRMQMITAIAACCTLVTGIFGMNLYSGYEQTAGTFWIVFGLLVGSFVVLTAFLLAFLTKKRVAPSAVVNKNKVQDLADEQQ